MIQPVFRYLYVLHFSFPPPKQLLYETQRLCTTSEGLSCLFDSDTPKVLGFFTSEPPKISHRSWNMFTPIFVLEIREPTTSSVLPSVVHLFSFTIFVTNTVGLLTNYSASSNFTILHYADLLSLTPATLTDPLSKLA